MPETQIGPRETGATENAQVGIGSLSRLLAPRVKQKEMRQSARSSQHEHSTRGKAGGISVTPPEKRDDDRPVRTHAEEMEIIKFYFMLRLKKV